MKKNDKKISKTYLIVFTTLITLKKRYFKIFEILEQFMIDAFLIKIPQLEKTGSIGSISKVLIPLKIYKLKSLSKSQLFTFFSRHFHVRIWRVLVP